MDSGWLYIAHTRQFIDTNVNIFKIGKSIDVVITRKSGYAKGSKLLFICYSSNIKAIEDRIKIDFKLLFTPRPDHGTEYFQGSYQTMRKEMLKIIENFDDCQVGKSDYIKSPFKTLQHFVNELLEMTNDYGIGVTLKQLHNIYMTNWLPNNQVDIAYINMKEFSDKISKFIGKPIVKSNEFVFLGKKLLIEIDTDDSKQDPWKEFIDSKLIKSPGSFLKWKNLKIEFMAWLKSKFGICVKIANAKEYLSQHLGKYSKTTIDHKTTEGYYGWSLV